MVLFNIGFITVSVLIVIGIILKLSSNYKPDSYFFTDNKNEEVNENHF